MMVAVERAPWQSARIVSTLLLVFLAGATAGALSMRLGLHEKLHRAAVAASPEPNREAVLNRFRTELGLSSAQTDQIALVLDDYGRYYQNLREQLDDVRATGKIRILQILNDDQRVKFEKMMSELMPQFTSTPGGK